MERAFFDEAFKEQPDVCPEEAAAAIVNHHLLAKSLIADTLSCLDPNTPLVVLVSPNHFSRRSSGILASAAVWTTPYGDLEPANGEIEALARHGVLKIEEEPFELEHGIGNIVAFIKWTMPSAKVLPIIFKDAADDASIARLVKALDEMLPKNAVIVGSLDFSHELTPVAADFHDAKSLSVIETGNVERLHPLDIDSEPALKMILNLMDRRGTSHFMLTGHSNSAEVFERDLDGDVTSYLTGLFVPGQAASEPSVALLFAGDVMLDRWVEQTIKKHGLAWIFQPIRRLLLGSDAVVANLEGAVSDDPQESEDSLENPLRFVFDAARLPALKAAGFTHVSLSNNHSDNNGGERGIAKTRDLLDRQGFRYFGGTRNATGTSEIVEAGGLRIGLVGYNAFGGGGLDQTLAEIARLVPETDAIAVMPHWGFEYQSTPSEEQRRVAHTFIEAGADLVIGSHPHVIQPIEVYQGKVIFYSLGNFVFDQIDRLETRQGLTLGVDFSEETIAFSLIPIESENVQLRLSKSAERASVLGKIASGSKADPAVIEGIKTGYFKLPYER